MDAVWTLIGLGMLGAVAAMLVWSHGRVREADLGFVSQQWLAEQRHSQTHDLHS